MDLIDATLYFIVLLIGLTCFEHYYVHHQELATHRTTNPLMKHTTHKRTPRLIYLHHGAESFLRTNWFAASQGIPHISRNPNVHYRTHKRPPPVSILGQPNPVHLPTSHPLEIHSNIIHPSTPRKLEPRIEF